MSEDMVGHSLRKIATQCICMVQHPHLPDAFQSIICDDVHKRQIAPRGAHDGSFNIDDLHIAPTSALLPSAQISLHIGETTAMCGYVACQFGMMCPHVVYQDARAALIGSEHLVMYRHKQFHSGGSSQVSSLALVQ